MRKIEVRLPGKTWEQADSHMAHAVQITSNGDLVLMQSHEQPVEGGVLMQTRLQHAYSSTTWAEFRDAGEIVAVSETRQ